MCKHSLTLLRGEKTGDRKVEYDCTIRSPLSPANLEGEIAMLLSEWWRLLIFNSPSMSLVDLCSSKPWFSKELLGAVLLLESQ